MSFNHDLPAYFSTTVHWCLKNLMNYLVFPVKNSSPETTKKLFYLLSIIKDVKEYETHNGLGNVQRTLLIPEAVTSRYHDNKIFGSK